MYLSRGMGAVSTEQLETSGAQTVLGAAGTVASAAVVSAGTIAGISAAVAVPVIGVAIAGISLLVTDLIENSGCGVTCVETSSWANQAGTLLGQNIAAYFALPVPRSASSQAAALANFDQIWAQLVANCSQPGTGTAGQDCISDRQEGACKWTQPASSVPPWGTPAAGECWNWFNGYRDPIANDANVAEDATAAAANPTAYSSTLTGGSSLGELLLLGAAAFVVYLVVS